MAICKRCKQQIKFGKVSGKFHPLDLDGSPHDVDECNRLRTERFMTLGTFHEKVENFTNGWGEQEVTIKWYELEGERMEIYKGPYLAYPH